MERRVRMKVLMINSVCGIRSTGRICTDIAGLLEEQGHECKIAYGRESVPEKYRKYAIRVGSRVGVYFHALLARIFDRAGFGSKTATRRLIKQIKEYDPDIIHLHNLHGYYVHIGVLFDFLRKYNKPILWSYYDCWSFTGHCAHFDFNRCDKWKSGCERCAYKREYPRSIFCGAKRNYKKKKELFTGLSRLQLIVPSRWMQAMAGQSYMKEYPICVLPNGIDLNVFGMATSDFKAKNGVTDKFMVLGVSSFWNKMKGLDVFNRLAEDLDDKIFQVVLVGKAEEGSLSDKILHIPATNNIKELCALYTAADVFVNPTLQETQGLTTIEAFSCGTPAVVFDSGGAAECVDDTCGLVVDRGDYDGLLDAILRLQQKKVLFDAQDCIRAAQGYEANRLCQDFVRLYKEVLGE